MGEHGGMEVGAFAQGPVTYAWGETTPIIGCQRAAPQTFWHCERCPRMKSNVLAWGIAVAVCSAVLLVDLEPGPPAANKLMQQVSGLISSLQRQLSHPSVVSKEAEGEANFPGVCVATHASIAFRHANWLSEQTSQCSAFVMDGQHVSDSTSDSSTMLMPGPLPWAQLLACAAKHARRAELQQESSGANTNVLDTISLAGALR